MVEKHEVIEQGREFFRFILVY